jgi:hypothetical protein
MRVLSTTRQGPSEAGAGQVRPHIGNCAVLYGGDLEVVHGARYRPRPTLLALFRRRELPWRVHPPAIAPGMPWWRIACRMPRSSWRVVRMPSVAESALAAAAGLPNDRHDGYQRYRECAERPAPTRHRVLAHRVPPKSPHSPIRARRRACWCERRQNARDAGSCTDGRPGSRNRPRPLISPGPTSASVSAKEARPVWVSFLENAPLPVAKRVAARQLWRSVSPCSGSGRRGSRRFAPKR